VPRLHCFCLALCGLFVTALVADSQDPAAWGHLKGRIVWAGEKLPEVKGFPVGEEWVINPKSRGIRWVMVWLTPVPGKQLPIHPDLKEIKEKPVPLDVVNDAVNKYVFSPHNLIIREGQELEVSNRIDRDCCFSFGGHILKNPLQTLQVGRNKAATIKGLRADRLPLCAYEITRAWMKAYVRVLDHPYFAVTDAEGHFEIKQAPVGEWKLMIWHDSGWIGGVQGRDGRPVTIKGNATTDLGKIEWRLPAEDPIPRP
jgi:hypothetical protein